MNATSLGDAILASTRSDNFMLPDIPRQLALSNTLDLIFTQKLDDFYEPLAKCIASFTATFLHVYSHYIDMPIFSEDDLYKKTINFYNKFDDNPSLGYGIRAYSKDLPFHMALLLFASGLEGFIFLNVTEKQQKIVRNILLNATIYGIAYTFTRTGVTPGIDFAEDLAEGSGADLESELQQSMLLLKKRSEVLSRYILNCYADDPLQSRYAYVLWNCLNVA
jgi:hypothetical protein